MPLPGSDKYRVIPPAKVLTWKEWIIERANLEVRIEDVLKKTFDIVVPYEARSWKTMCPLAREHEDGGLDKQFRIYSDSNSAWCFAMHGRFDNIKLWQLRFFTAGKEETAKAILDEWNLDYRHKTYQEKFDEIRNESRTGLMVEDLVQAFRVFLSGQENYIENQYRQEVLDGVDLFLTNVNQICESSNTKEVQQWFQSEKDRVLQLLNSLDLKGGIPQQR